MEKIRGYLVMLLLMRLLPYVVPKEHYEKSIRKLIAIWMTILLVSPVLQWVKSPDLSEIVGEMERVEKRVEESKFVGGETIFEIFPVEQDY